jgi:hypothetical protein
MVTILKNLFLVLIGDRYRSDLTKDNPYRGLNDEELVKTIIETKNTLLFGIIYDRYANKIYTKCAGFSRSDDEAADLTQDVFLMIFVKMGSFKGNSKFSSWVYALTYNFCVNYGIRAKYVDEFLYCASVYVYRIKKNTTEFELIPLRFGKRILFDKECAKNSIIERTKRRFSSPRWTTSIRLK